MCVLNTVHFVVSYLNKMVSDRFDLVCCLGFFLVSFLTNTVQACTINRDK